MTVFRGFFLMVKKNILLLLMFIGIFVFVCAINTTSTSGSFEDEKISIAVVSEEDTALTRSLITKLNEKTEIVDISEDEIEDALFYQDIAMALYIDEGFSDDFRIGDGDQKIRYLVTNSTVSTYQVQSLIDSFLALIKTYSDCGIIDDTTMEAYMSANSASIDEMINITVVDNTNNYRNTTNFFNMLGYVIPAALVTIVGLILLSFKPIDIQRRLNIAPLSNLKKTVLLVLSSLVLGILLLVACLILGKYLYGTIDLKYELLFYLNAFVFTLVIVAISYLFQTAIESKDAISAIGVIFSLGCSFFCGVFIRQEYLSSTILNISKVLPQYWFIKNNENLFLANGTAGVDYASYFGLIGVQMIFFFVFVAGSVLVSRIKSKREA